MAFIATVDEDDATAEVAELYARDREHRGYVPDYARVFATHPAVYEAWRGLAAAVAGTLDPRRYELVTVAAARRLTSSYCALAHGQILAERWYGADGVVQLVEDPEAAGIDAADRALMALAEQVVDDATAITADDIQRLRDLGISDADIAGAVMAATMRCFFSKTLDALGAQPDPVYRDLDPRMRDVLTVGREIAPAPDA